MYLEIALTTLSAKFFRQSSVWSRIQWRALI